MIPETILSFDTDSLCNRHGSIRVKLVRKHYGIEIREKDLPELIELHNIWRDTVEVMPIRLTYSDVKYLDLKNTPVDVDKWINRYNNETGKIAVRFNETSNIVCYESTLTKWIIRKCCKRGNDVYVKLVREKFKPLLNSENHIDFFSTVLNEKRKRVLKTRLLYITGTCDRNITGNISNSWINFGIYWNSFITNIREMFDGVEYVRAWQSQENGYPHFHALVYFKNYEFTAIRWLEKDGKKVTWRIHNRQMLNGEPVRDKIKNAWKWGNLDIQCCNSSKKALYDLLKYITRDLKGGESDLTNTMVWYYGKQSYSFSEGFTALFEPDLTIGEPTDDDSINAEGVIQRNNSKKKLIRIEVFPVLKYSILEDLYKNTLFFWENHDEPPPPIINYLENFVDSCKPVKFNKREFEDGNFIDVVTYDYSQ